jgi:CRP-like cAMP-binding protein
MRATDLEVLRKTPILQGLSTGHLERLLQADPAAVYRRDQAVFEAGSRDRSLFIVLEGAVAVKIDPAKLGTIEKGSTELRTIRTLGPGESFGEIDLIDGQGREATVVAATDQTRLLVIASTMFEDVLPAQVILHNITRDLASKVRGTNQLLIESLLSGYFLTVLVEGLASGSYECDPITPLQNLVLIRNPENFILSGPGQLIASMPEKEALEVSFFAEPHLLQALASPGAPSGAIVFSALFSLIKWGQLSSRIEAAPFQYELQPDTDRRAGTLRVNKALAGRVQPFTLEWQVKGARYDAPTATTTAELFLFIYTDEASSTRSRARSVIDQIDMPVQQHICRRLPQDGADKSRFRVLVVHHRSHETARTLRSLQELGYELDTFIGIPYGASGGIASSCSITRPSTVTCRSKWFTTSSSRLVTSSISGSRRSWKRGPSAT